MLQVPMICDSSISWKAREASIDSAEWGDPVKRGPTWEAMAAVTALMAGAELIVVRHPGTLKIVRETIKELEKAKDVLGGGA